MLRDEMKRVGGATLVGVHQRLRRRPQAAPVQLRGNDIGALNAGGRAGARRSCEQVPGAVDVGLSTKGQKPELDVELNRGVAGSLGVTVGQVAQSLRPAFAGIDAGDWVDPERRDARRAGAARAGVAPQRATTCASCRSW